MTDATLDERIRHWIGEGFQVKTQTPTSASLVKPRRFNPAEFVLMPLYAIEYLGQREQSVFISIGTDGRLEETKTGMERSAYRRMQDQSAPRRFLNVVIIFVVVTAVLVILGFLFGRR